MMPLSDIAIAYFFLEVSSNFNRIILDLKLINNNKNDTISLFITKVDRSFVIDYSILSFIGKQNKNI